MEFVKKKITPAMAEKMLNVSSDFLNRVLKPHHVERLANDMKNGRWKEDTGETIKIDRYGVVIDGQHRLWAVIKSNIPISFHIAYNVQKEVFDVLDTNIVRTKNDAFHIAGISYANILPSIIIAYSQIKSKKRHMNKAETNSEILNEYTKREEFWQDVARKTRAWYMSMRKVLTPSTIGAMYALFYEKDKSGAEDFFNQLTSGENITNKIIVILKNKLVQDKLSSRKMKPIAKEAIIVKAWNIFRTNADKRILSFSPDAEHFPTPI